MPAAKFDYTLDFKAINFREHPEQYRIGKGEQGVLLVEPYKSEILPYWKFKTPADAVKSSTKIYSLFVAYGKQNDFAGMDMSRKFLQMGYTRSRRYANHQSGKKYDGPVPDDKKGQSGAHGRSILPRRPDEEKAKSAAIFYEQWQKAKKHKKYNQLMEKHRKMYEQAEV